MGTSRDLTCNKCSGTIIYVLDDDPPAEGITCGTCKLLGDRSLLWVMQAFADATTDEERTSIRERFAAAEGRSWQWPDIIRCIERGEQLPPGILQRESEREKQNGH